MEDKDGIIIETGKQTVKVKVRPKQKPITEKDVAAVAQLAIARDKAKAVGQGQQQREEAKYEKEYAQNKIDEALEKSSKAKTDAILYWRSLTPEKARSQLARGFADALANLALASWVEMLKIDLDLESNPKTKEKIKSLIKRAGVFTDPLDDGLELGRQESKRKDPIDEARLTASQWVTRLEQQALDSIDESDKQKAEKDPLGFFLGQMRSDTQSLEPFCETDHQKQDQVKIKNSLEQIEIALNNLRKFSEGKTTIPFDHKLGKLNFGSKPED